MIYKLLSTALRLKYALLPHRRRRTQAVSLGSYEADWQNLDRFFSQTRDFIDGDKLIQLTPVEFKRRCIVEIVAAQIRQLNAKRVLEVGCGFGINLAFLGDAFPEVGFVGIEPTDAGVRQAQELVGKNVEVLAGSALGPTQGEYDLVFTSAVLEQLHNYIGEAFQNIFAIPAKQYLFYESWLEGLDGRTLCHQLRADYFRGSKELIREYGVEEVAFWVPEIQPEEMRYSVLVCRRMDEDQGSAEEEKGKGNRGISNRRRMRIQNRRYNKGRQCNTRRSIGRLGRKCSRCRFLGGCQEMADEFLEQGGTSLDLRSEA